MRSDDKSKDDVSPPAGYGNKDEPKPVAAAAPPVVAAADAEPAPLELPPPDASLVPQAQQDALGHIAAIVAAVVNAVPTLHNQAARVIAMQEALGVVVYNSPPPTPPVTTTTR